MTDLAVAAPGSLCDLAACPRGVPGLRPAAVRAGAMRPARPWIAVLDSHRLLQARRRRGLSQEKLAWQSGVSVTTVARLEREPRPRCQKRTLALIAEALGEHPDAITAPVPASQRQPGDGTATDGAGDLQPERTQESSWMCSRTFPARADQIGQAREFLGRILAGCPVTDDMVLICSELATNAVLHSDSARPGGRFTVRAEVREGDYAWIEVEDQGGRWAPGESPDQSGRGLMIVSALADYLDIRGGDDTGRLVCARLDWPVVMGDRA